MNHHPHPVLIEHDQGFTANRATAPPLVFPEKKTRQKEKKKGKKTKKRKQQQQKKKHCPMHPLRKLWPSPVFSCFPLFTVPAS
jgi:hypothetical protein